MTGVMTLISKTCTVHSFDSQVTRPSQRGHSGRAQEVEEEEDEHLYHTTGWTRELWIETLGMPAVPRRRRK